MIHVVSDASNTRKIFRLPSIQADATAYPLTRGQICFYGLRDVRRKETVNNASLSE